MSVLLHDNLNKKYNFEGLADVTKPAKYFFRTIDQDTKDFNDPKKLLCVTSGKYRVGKGGDAETVVAIAIGLWDEERNCFSVLKKMKDGKSLPLPFTVKVDKNIDKKEQAIQMYIRAKTILQKIGIAQNLEGVLEQYNKAARANQ